MRTPRAAVLVAAATFALLTGCSGNDGKTEDGSALADRLAAAQQHITDAEALTISLSTESLPDGITGLSSAKGRGYQGETADGAAFTGDVDVISGGSTIKADVVAVQGKVWAKTDLAPVYLTIDPKTLHAPDPASLLGAKGEGLPLILVETQKLKDGGKSRDGRDVLTTIEGTLPGEVVHRFLPSADAHGTFSVRYRLTDDNVLQDASIKGPFYPGASDVTYQVKLTTNDDASAIEPPKR